MNEEEILVQNKSPEYKAKSLQALSQIVDNVQIDETKAINNLSRYKFDLEDVEEILSPLSSSIEDNLPELEITEKDVQMSFRRVVKNFVDDGIISSDLAEDVGRIIRPSDVLQGKAPHLYFLYNKDGFPASGESRGTISTSEFAFQNIYKKTQKDLEVVGVQLDEQRLLDLTLAQGISHEYGHAVDSALRARALEDLEKDGTLSNEEFFSAPKAIKEQSYLHVFSNINPTQEIHDHYTSQQDQVRTTQERISVGFEILGLKTALVEQGIDESTADNIINKNIEERNSRFEDYKKLVDHATKRNISEDELKAILYKVNSTLRKSEDEEKQKLAGVLPATIGPEYVGYMFPLNEQELKSYMNSFES